VIFRHGSKSIGGKLDIQMKYQDLLEHVLKSECQNGHVIPAVCESIYTQMA
jgi:hypothetical protein